MPLPIGFLLLTDKFIIAWVEALEIKSKCGVSPLITHPNAINPSYFLIFLEIVTGISKTTFEAIMNLSIQSKKPIGNGIITALNMSQANQRSGDPEIVLDKKKIKKGKGREAAKAVIAVLSK